jgi:hypothetical protein
MTGPEGGDRREYDPKRPRIRCRGSRLSRARRRHGSPLDGRTQTSRRQGRQSLGPKRTYLPHMVSWRAAACSGGVAPGTIVPHPWEARFGNRLRRRPDSGRCLPAGPSAVGGLPRHSVSGHQGRVPVPRGTASPVERPAGNFQTPTDAPPPVDHQGTGPGSRRAGPARPKLNSKGSGPCVNLRVPMTKA